MAPAKRSAWYGMLDGVTALVQAMDADLQRECGVPLTWYDTMVKLRLAPGGELRMSELAAQVHLSRSWLTRRVKQLEDAGLVIRRGSGGDGRGVVCSLTPLGAQRFSEWEASHADSIQQHFSSVVTAAEAAVLRDCGQRLASRARAELGKERTGGPPSSVVAVRHHRP